MPTTLGLTNRLRLAWHALTRGDAGGAVRAVSLEMDLQDRDQQIERMRREFELERQRAEAQATGAGEAELEALVKRLAGPLSNLAVLRHRHESGQEVQLPDLFKLCERFEQELADRGLERIGQVGAETGFDPSVHQRLSGGDTGEGDPVCVRFIGYRFSGKVLAKAMVTRLVPDENGAGDAPGEE